MLYAAKSRSTILMPPSWSLSTCASSYDSYLVAKWREDRVYDNPIPGYSTSCYLHQAPQFTRVCSWRGTVSIKFYVWAQQVILVSTLTVEMIFSMDNANTSVYQRHECAKLRVEVGVELITIFFEGGRTVIGDYTSLMSVPHLP